MANSVDPDQTAPIGAVCSWSTLFASMLNWSIMFCNDLQQTTSADVISYAFFLGALRINIVYFNVREMFTLSFIMCVIELYVISYYVFLFSLKFLVRV